jgi:hypothetical protein
MPKIRTILLATAITLGSAWSAAQAAVIGIIGSSQAEANAAALSAGHTAINLADLTAASLAGLDVIWVLNDSNSAEFPGQRC